MDAKNSKCRVTLFIPIKNEIDGLKVIMPRINRCWVDEIFILDAGSTDGSKEYLTSFGFDVVDQQSKGVKAAFWEAFEQIESDVIIPFSPDGNSIPEDIPRLIEQINNGGDIIIASRYKDGAKSADDNFQSALANKVLTGLINFFFRSKFTDGLNMYKAFYKKHLFDLEIDKYKNDHSEIMLLARGARYGLKVIEIASREPKRIGKQGSRAHPGLFGKYKSGILLIKTIVRDGLCYWPKK